MEVTTPVAAWGEPVEGWLRLDGASARPVTYAGISLVIMQSVEIAPGSGMRMYLPAAVATESWPQFMLRWRSSVQFPFRVVVPPGLPLEQVVQVVGRVYLGTGEHAVLPVKLRIEPPPCFATAVNHLASVSGYQAGDLRQTLGPECMVTLRPPGGRLSGRCLTLSVSLHRQELSGEVTLHTASGPAIGWLGWARTPHSFRFSCPLSELETLPERFERGLRALENRFNSLPIPAGSLPISLHTLPVTSEEPHSDCIPSR